MKKNHYITTLLIGCFFPFIWGQLSSKEIDSLVENTRKAFDVPGIAVGVIKDGKLIHAQGYGVRQLGKKTKVDKNTLFGIASNSKAFTTSLWRF